MASTALFSNVSKKSEEIPVDPCKGWVDACEYCDKRFGEWVAVEEETLEKIPENPGFLMIALKNKNINEVVSIMFCESNIQKSACEELERIKEHISDKKNKATKSKIQVRWMILKKVDNKEIAALCAHWCNNAVLPRYIKVWPGLEFLEKSETLVFSNSLQKWCYLKKDPVWRKAKTSSTKVSEMVEKCDWSGPCETCDSQFTAWKSLWDVLDNGSVPSDFGVYMLSLLQGKKREVVYIGRDPEKFGVRLDEHIKSIPNWINFKSKSRPADKKGILQIRWKVLNENKCDDKVCLLLAHWVNADSLPAYNNSEAGLGDNILNKNKNFEYRSNEKKWYYVTETLRSYKSSKEKDRKKDLMEDLNLLDDEYLD